MAFLHGNTSYDISNPQPYLLVSIGMFHERIESNGNIFTPEVTSLMNLEMGE